MSYFKSFLYLYNYIILSSIFFVLIKEEERLETIPAVIGREAGYTLDRAITEGQITIAPPGRKLAVPREKPCRQRENTESII